MPVKYGSLPFDAQIAFFRKKLALPTRGWTDIWQSNHDHAFVVAGATKMALVEDMQAAVQKAIEKGTTIAEFRKDFDKAVSDHGWSYNGSRGWRTRLIYQTNLRTSYAAGRHEQLQKLEYWQYHHSIGANNPREQHLAWDGLVLPKDDPFWNTHYPPNGWGCRCYVTGMSKTRMQQKGLSAGKSPTIQTQKVNVGVSGPNPRTVEVPEGISPGFAYAPGQSAWMHAYDLKQGKQSPFPFEQKDNGLFKKIPERGAVDLMLNPRAFPESEILPSMQAGQDAAYAKLFLKKFNADIGKPVTFIDASGDAMVISDAMFKNDEDAWKMGKGTRSAQLNMLADSIKNPDEIWGWVEWHRRDKKAISSRAYVSRYMVGTVQWLAITVMQRSEGKWQGTTVHTSSSSDDFNQKVEKNRRGVRLYRRP